MIVMDMIVVWIEIYKQGKIDVRCKRCYGKVGWLPASFLVGLGRVG